MNANHIKVNKSTAECAAHNLTENVALGLELEWEPSASVLKEEAAAAARVAAGFKLADDKLAVLQMLDPNATAESNRVCGVRVSIEETYSGGRKWSAGYRSGWKLVLGDGYGRDADKKWLVIGDGTTLGLNAKQLAKAQAHIATLSAIQAEKDAKLNAAQNQEQSTKAFITANPAFCALVGYSYYNSGETLHYGSGYNQRTSYQTAFIALLDGRIRIGSEMFSVAQWEQIYALRAAQAEAMKQLKQSFAAA